MAASYSISTGRPLRETLVGRVGELMVAFSAMSKASSRRPAFWASVPLPILMWYFTVPSAQSRMGRP